MRVFHVARCDIQSLTPVFFEMFNIENGIKIFEKDGSYAATKSQYPEYQYKGVKYGGKSNYGIVLFSDPSNHEFNEFIEIEYSNFCLQYNQKISRHYSICDVDVNGIYTEVFKQNMPKHVFITGLQHRRKTLSSKTNDVFTWILGTDYLNDYHYELHKDALMFAVYIDVNGFIRKDVTDLYNFPNIRDTKFNLYCIGDIDTINPIYGLEYTIYNNPKSNIDVMKIKYNPRSTLDSPSDISVISNKIVAYVNYDEIPQLTEGKIEPKKLDYCHSCGHKLYGDIYLSYDFVCIYCNLCAHTYNTYVKKMEKMYIAKHPTKIEDVIRNYYDEQLADVLVQCVDTHPVKTKSLIYKCDKDNSIICFAPFYLLKETLEDLDNCLKLDCKLIIITYQPTVDDMRNFSDSVKPVQQNEYN